jgi:DNA-binding response OmpR family regulator
MIKDNLENDKPKILNPNKMSEENKNILLVEDDAFIRDIYNTKFTQEGFNVVCAENGIEALKKLEEITPDLILLDVIMPYMDGMEALKKIKENDAWKKIPVIMLTNISEKEKVSEDMELEVDDYLIKSHFTPSEVVAKVNALLKD